MKLYLKVQNVFTSLKLAACLMIIGGGIYELVQGNFGNLKSGFDNTTASPGGIASAMFSGLFAFEGWFAELSESKTTNTLRSCLQEHNY